CPWCSVSSCSTAARFRLRASRAPEAPLPSPFPRSRPAWTRLPVEPRSLALLVLLAAAPGALPCEAASLDRANELTGPAPGGITGRVMNAQGGPLAGAKVILRRGEFSTTTRTDDQGDYCFCRVKPARDYVFEIELDGFAGFIE